MRKMTLFVCSQCLKVKNTGELDWQTEDYSICKSCSGKKKTIEEPVYNNKKLLVESLLSIR